MPRAHPSYPYMEPCAIAAGRTDLLAVIHDLLSQNPHICLPGGGALDPLCRALNLDVEYSDPPNEILLDVPVEGKAVVWLPRKGRVRQDRMALATAVGHWLLHVPPMRETDPNRGIQALYAPTDPEARDEAWRFACELLMPCDIFRSYWSAGRATHTADMLNVPTQVVYDRAAELMLTDETAQDGPVPR